MPISKIKDQECKKYQTKTPKQQPPKQEPLNDDCGMLRLVETGMTWHDHCQFVQKHPHPAPQKNTRFGRFSYLKELNTSCDTELA